MYTELYRFAYKLHLSSKYLFDITDLKSSGNKTGYTNKNLKHTCVLSNKNYYNLETCTRKICGLKTTKLWYLNK